MKNWKEALDILKGRLVARYGNRLCRLVIFGSTARKQANSESDLDVAVVLKDLSDFWTELKNVGDIAYQVSLETDFQVLISPFLFDETDFKRGAGILLRNIRKEGAAV